MDLLLFKLTKLEKWKSANGSGVGFGLEHPATIATAVNKIMDRSMLMARSGLTVIQRRRDHSPNPPSAPTRQATHFHSVPRFALCCRFVDALPESPDKFFA